MVKERTGDEIDIVRSSIHSVMGASVSTSLYVVSGLIYTVATDVSTAGLYMFILVTVALFMRPVKGTTKSMHKIGTEVDENVGSYLTIAIVFGFSYLLLFIAFLFILTPIISQYTIYEERLLVPVIAIASIQIIGSISFDLISSVGYPGKVSWFTGLSEFIKYIIILLFMDHINTVGEITLVHVTTGFVVSAIIFSYYGVRPKKPSRNEVQRVWQFSKWESLNQVFDRFTYNMPSYVLSVVATPAAVGIYESADRFADFGATISWNLSKPILSKVSGEWSLDPDSKQQYLDTVVTGGIGVTFIVFGYLTATADLLAALVFAEYQTVFAYTIILVGGVNILRGFWTILTNVMKGVNRPDIGLKTKLIGVIVSLPITIILGSQFGALGGAIGYAVMNITIGSFVILYSYRFFDRILLDFKLVVKFIFAMLVASIFTYVFVTVYPENNIVSSIIGVSICVLTYAGVMYATSEKMKMITSDAKTMIREYIKKQT